MIADGGHVEKSWYFQNCLADFDAICMMTHIHVLVLQSLSAVQKFNFYKSKMADIGNF